MQARHFSRQPLIVALMSGIALLLLTACGLEPIFSYQGYLTDSSGQPVADGDYDAMFRLYHSPTGGTAVYTDTATITVKNGLFDTSVGDADVPTEIYSEPVWLEVTVEGETLTPRQPLRGAPYAFSLASGAIVQGSEPLERTILTQEDTGAALAVANTNSTADGGHGLVALNSATNQNSAAVAGIARGDSYGGYFVSDGYRGLYADGSTGYFAAYFDGSIYVGGTCTNCATAQLTRNVGDQALEPGDLVTVAGVAMDPDLETPILQVRRAEGPTDVIIGVMEGALERAPVGEFHGQPTGGFDPAGGAAAPGAYASVIIQGLAQAKVAPGSTLSIGEYVTAGGEGSQKASSSDARVGRVMSTPDKDGMVWVLVGGQ